MQDQNEAFSKFTTGTFSFSGTNINDLESSEYTIVTICIDSSYSIEGFRKELVNALKNVIQSCQDSPRSDNLLVRVTKFDINPEEVHGFKELNKCALPDYDNLLSNLGIRTSLYDAAVDAAESVGKYGKELCDAEYTSNGLLVLITDGLDNNSTYTRSTVKEKLANAVGEGKLESLVSLLVGVNTGDSVIRKNLNDFATEAGFSNYLNVSEANPKHLAKLAQFISQSITSQSKSLNTGKPAAVASLNI